MDVYDPDIAPDPDAWLAMDQSARTALVDIAHDGRFPDALHNAQANRIMHASLHQIVETQNATNDPPQVRAALERLTGEGLKRHAAVHAVMQELARHLASLGDGAPFGKGEYGDRLDRLSAADALGTALQQMGRRDPAPMNRAQRRAAKRKKRRP